MFPVKLEFLVFEFFEGIAGGGNLEDDLGGNIIFFPLLVRPTFPLGSAKGDHDIGGGGCGGVAFNWIPQQIGSDESFFEQRVEFGVDGGNQVESRGVITLRPSQLDPDVPVSVHPAPDNLPLRVAHVDVLVARLVNRHQVLRFPIVMVAVDVVEVYLLFS